MRTFTLHTELWLPRPPECVFPFFADAHNLESITPPLLRFSVLTPAPIQMRQGALIDYRLRIRGVPVGWRTRIAAWEPPTRFIDEQLRGPYRLWHHEHTFIAENGGTRCVDHVRYAVPGGPLVERAVHRLLVRRDVERIFAFRQERLRAIFGAEPGQQHAAQSGTRAIEWQDRDIRHV